MKRFTETDKWRDTWFRKLKPMSKLAFMYIVDNCDSAGVWDPDYDLANFTIGEEVNWVEVLTDFAERVETLPNGKWHLTRFVEFQYGELVPDCRPHAKILALLKAHGIGYPKGIHTHKERKGKEEGKGKEGSAETAITAEAIYEQYPRKDSRKEGIRAIDKALKHCQPVRLFALTRAYAEAVARWPKDRLQFVPHASTWFNQARYEDDATTWEYNAGYLAGTLPAAQRIVKPIPAE